MNFQYQITDEYSIDITEENDVNSELINVEDEDYFVWNEELKCFQESKKLNIQRFLESSETNYDVCTDSPIQNVEEVISSFQVTDLTDTDDQHNILVDLGMAQSLNQTDIYNIDFSPSTEDSNKSSLQNIEIQDKTNVNNCEIHKNMHFVDVMKSARDLYTKKTRTLMHWINPEIPMSVIAMKVHSAWENLPESQKQIYVSQVVGRFAPEINTAPIINPELLSFNNEINSNDKLFKTRTYTPKNVIKKDKNIKATRTGKHKKNTPIIKNIERTKKLKQSNLKVQDEAKSHDSLLSFEPRQCLSYWGNQGLNYYNFDDAVLTDLS